MKGSLLYEGKAKKVYSLIGEEYELILEYKDEATAFNGKKHQTFRGKGRLNNLISAHVFSYLKLAGIPTHFIQTLSDTEQLVKQSQIIPLEVVVRNVAAGSMTRRLGLEEGTELPKPIVEFYYKSDDLDDPFINDEHARFLAKIDQSDLDHIKAAALRVNHHLQVMFSEIELRLIDFKLEFGRLHDGSIVLSDEISPDTCRLWDQATNRKMDKDVFRNDIEDLVEIYEIILKRLEAIVHV